MRCSCSSPSSSMAGSPPAPSHFVQFCVILTPFSSPRVHNDDDNNQKEKWNEMENDHMGCSKRKLSIHTRINSCVFFLIYILYIEMRKKRRKVSISLGQYKYLYLKNKKIPFCVFLFPCVELIKRHTLVSLFFFVDVLCRRFDKLLQVKHTRLAPSNVP